MSVKRLENNMQPENMQFRLSTSQPYLVNTNPDTNHSANPTNPNGNSKQ